MSLPLEGTDLPGTCVVLICLSIGGCSYHSDADLMQLAADTVSGGVITRDMTIVRKADIGDRTFYLVEARSKYVQCIVKGYGLRTQNWCIVLGNEADSVFFHGGHS